MKTNFTKLILLVAAALCSATGFAQTWTSGATTVTLNATGDTITVTGSGAMANAAPWSSSLSTVTAVIVKAGVTSIGNNAFNGATALETVSLPAGLTSIGNNAFRNTALETVTFPASLTSIGNNAFNSITTLDVIVFEGNTPPTIGTNVFTGVVWPAAEVIVPAGSEAAYSAVLPSGASSVMKSGYWVKTIALPKEAGTATPALEYTSEEFITIVAAAKSGYAFVNWTIDGKVVSTDESYELKVANVTVIANFNPAPVNFTPKEVYYNGLPKSVQITVSDKAVGEVTAVYYRYLGKEGAALSTTPPTELGSYQILVDLAPSATYPVGIRISLGTFSIVEAPESGPGLPRPIYLSVSAGITTSPAAGLIYITSGKDLVITARTSSTTPGLVPVVIAEPAIDAANIKYEPNADGSFTITVSNLRQETRISLNFVAASTAVDATQIWAAGSQLYIATVQAGEARIYNLVGRQVKALALAAGETYTETLPTGVYIVTLNGKSYKVLVGK